MILIPFDPMASADQIVRIQPGNQLIQMRLMWNVRSNFWTMDISGDFGKVLGLKLVPDWPILRGREATSLLEGDFIVRPLTKEVVGRDSVAYEDLGVKWGLLWMTPDEKDAWEAFYGLE